MAQFDAADNFVLCRGTLIPRACDRFLRSQADFDRLRSDSPRDGSVVGFHPHDARIFERVLKDLRCSIVVVVVDHERQSRCHSFPPLPVEAYIAACIESPRVRHWFVENWRGPAHPKVTCRPIGLSWNHLSLAPLYAALLDAIAAAPAMERKPLRVLANFQHQNHAQPASGELPNERKLLAEQLRGNPLITFDKKREQGDCWRAHADYAFEISPRGNGLDCHRTWEALLLNTIPIVRSCSLDLVHRAFPVVIVQRWDEITEDNLRRWQQALAPQFTAAMKQQLNTAHWVALIRSASE
jgi:hypothetical protein